MKHTICKISMLGIILITNILTGIVFHYDISTVNQCHYSTVLPRRLFNIKSIEILIRIVF